MVNSKQHQPVFEVLKELIEEGLSIKLIVMDDGPLRPELEAFIKINQLEEYILLVGFQKDFINYKNKKITELELIYLITNKINLQEIR